MGLGLEEVKEELITQEAIEDRIFIIRGQKVMIDRDLAQLYGVNTKQLNQAVKRNTNRFPEHFMFQLSEQEKLELVTNCDRFETLKHSTVNPAAFTEYGAVMLASVLNSDRAVKMSIFIVNTFIRLRQMLASNTELSKKFELLEKRVLKHDSDIRELVRDIRKLTIEKTSKKFNIGFLK